MSSTSSAHKLKGERGTLLIEKKASSTRTEGAAPSHSSLNEKGVPSSTHSFFHRLEERGVRRDQR